MAPEEHPVARRSREDQAMDVMVRDREGAGPCKEWRLPSCVCLRRAKSDEVDEQATAPVLLAVTATLVTGLKWS